MTPSDHRQPDHTPISSSRAVVEPFSSRAVETRRPMLPALAQRALPVLTRSAAAMAVGFAAEYALRSLSNRAISAITSPLRSALVPPRPPSHFVRRTVVTEMFVIERMRRHS